MKRQIWRSRKRGMRNKRKIRRKGKNEADLQEQKKVEEE